MEHAIVPSGTVRNSHGFGGGKKTRTGCTTCKIRHLKCDETWPSCKRCISAGRTCDLGSGIWRTKIGDKTGLQTPNIRRFVCQPSYALSLDQSKCPQQRRSFEYFCSKAAPSFSGLENVDFWCHVVPQFGRSSAMVWKAVIAVGLFYELSTETTNSGSKLQPYVSARHITALTWYNRALANAQNLLNKGPDNIPVAVFSIVLFTAIEFLQDNLSRALELMTMAPKLLHRSGSSKASQTISAKLLPIVQWLARLNGCFGNAESDMIFQGGAPKALSVMPRFETLQEARLYLHSIIPEFHALYYQSVEYKTQVDQNSAGLASIKAQQVSIKQHLQMWLDCFHRSHHLTTRNEDKMHVAALIKDHAMHVIVSQTSLATEQSEYDLFFPLFASIVNSVETILASSGGSNHESTESGKPIIHFRFDWQIIPTLLFVIERCRHPATRRRALALMLSAPQKEGLWRSAAALRVMQRLVSYEEGCCDGHNPSATSTISIPTEESRIHNWHVLKEGWQLDEDFSARCDSKPVWMKVSRYTKQPNGAKTCMEETILV